MRHESSPVDSTEYRTAGVAAGLGCSIVVTIVVCIVGGVFLDNWLGTSPWLTLTGVGLGLAASAYQLYELAMLDKKDESPKLVTRQFQKIAQMRSGHTPVGSNLDSEDQE